jgi:hypothetical protein
MSSEAPELTPKERLEATRRAIAGELARKRGGTIRTEEAEFFAAPKTMDTGIVASARRAGRAWWQSHPVHRAVDLAHPLLEEYAHRKPYQLLGMAAATGAALTLLKSFRLLSLTGIAIALLKTTDIKSAARSFMGSGMPSQAAPPGLPER